ncbi:MAG: aspartate aminotransferase family protein, partial [Lacisediminihabitans sp.]
PDGTRLPRTTHLTVTPVTEGVLGELSAALVRAANEVRGIPSVAASDVLGALPPEFVAGLSSPDAAQLDSESAYGLLVQIGLITPGDASGQLPERMAPFIALIEALPAALTERLLTELLARLVEPA